MADDTADVRSPRPASRSTARDVRSPGRESARPELERDIGKLLSEVEKANAWLHALGRHVRARLRLAPEPGPGATPLERIVERSALGKTVLLERRPDAGGEVLQQWTPREFRDHLLDLQEQYVQLGREAGAVPAAGVWDDAPALAGVRRRLLGVAYVHLSPLAWGLRVEAMVPIIDREGNGAGMVAVRATGTDARRPPPVQVLGSLAESGSALSFASAASSAGCLEPPAGPGAGAIDPSVSEMDLLADAAEDPRCLLPRDPDRDESGPRTKPAKPVAGQPFSVFLQVESVEKIAPDAQALSVLCRFPGLAEPLGSESVPVVVAQAPVRHHRRQSTSRIVQSVPVAFSTRHDVDSVSEAFLLSLLKDAVEVEVWAVSSQAYASSSAPGTARAGPAHVQQHSAELSSLRQEVLRDRLTQEGREPVVVRSPPRSPTREPGSPSSSTTSQGLPHGVSVSRMRPVPAGPTSPGPRANQQLAPPAQPQPRSPVAQPEKPGAAEEDAEARRRKFSRSLEEEYSLLESGVGRRFHVQATIMELDSQGRNLPCPVKEARGLDPRVTFRLASGLGSASSRSLVLSLVETTAGDPLLESLLSVAVTDIKAVSTENASMSNVSVTGFVPHPALPAELTVREQASLVQRKELRAVVGWAPELAHDPLLERRSEHGTRVVLTLRIRAFVSCSARPVDIDFEVATKIYNPSDLSTRKMLHPGGTDAASVVRQLASAGGTNYRLRLPPPQEGAAALLDQFDDQLTKLEYALRLESSQQHKSLARELAARDPEDADRYARLHQDVLADLDRPTPRAADRPNPAGRAVKPAAVQVERLPVGEAVVRRGFLQVATKPGSRRKRVWAVLRPPYLLLHKDPGDEEAEDPAVAVADLAGAAVTATSDDYERFTFRLEASGGKSWTLEASNRREADCWADCLVGLYGGPPPDEPA